jgi:Flp pilus assembly pilin Flp
MSISIWPHLASFARREHGASAAEYALMLAVVTGCAMVALHSLGAGIAGAFNRTIATLRH